MPLSTARLVQNLHRLAAPSRAAETDAALLRRFARDGDQDAFAALVARHAPLVLRLCRRLLADSHAAEDACQATFLVLARRAGALRRPAALAGWLYGVAYRVALRERAAAARRRRREAPAPGREPPDPHPDPLAALTARDLLAAVEEEIQRLPEAHRLPVILCCVEGLSQEEAARRLGWTAGSVKGRLERGRARLHARLARRGLTLVAALAALEVARAGAAPLAAPITQAALAFAAGRTTSVSARAALLAEGGLRGMMAAKVKLGVMLLLVAAAGLAAAGVAIHEAPAAKQPEAAQGATPASPPQSPDRGGPNGKAVARTDRYGDPLPPGALARLGTVRFRHGGQIMALALSPDRKTIATGGYPGLVCLWETATGRPLGTLRGAEGHVLALGFSPDGKVLAATGTEGTADKAPGRTVLWDLRTRKPRRTLAHAPWARCLAWSPDGSTMAVGCDRDEFKTWDVATGKEGPRLQGNFAQGIGAAAFSPDGRLLASGGYDKFVRLWDWRTGQEVRHFDTGSMVRSIVFAADGKTLLTGQDGPQFVRLWDVASGKPLRDFPGHKGWKGGFFPGSSYSAALSPDGRTVASGGDDGAVLLWDAATGKPRARHQTFSGSVHGVAFTPDGKTLIAAGTTGRVQLFDVATGKELHLFDEHAGAVGCMALSRDGKLLATAGEDRTIRLWDLATGRTVRVLKGHDRPVYSVSFSPDGRSLASGGGDGTVRVWEVATGRQRQLTDAHCWDSRVAYAPDGKLASAGGDSKVRLWDPASGRQIAQMTGHTGYAVRLDFSPDGKWLASTADSYGDEHGFHEDRTVRLWDVARRAEYRCFTRADHYSGPQAFSPDSRSFVYDDGGRLHWVDLATGLERGGSRFTGVAHFAFSPTGRWLLTIGKDRSLQITEVATGLELRRIVPPECGVFRVAFAPDGRTLLTLNGDATVLVWDLAPPDGDRRGASRPEDFDSLWADLAAADGPRAYRAMWVLAADPAPAVAGLRRRLPESLRALAERGLRIRALVADLDSDSFDRRAAASRELAGFGAEAEPALRRALAARPSAEARKRLEELLPRAGNQGAGEALRCLRAAEVLERIGTPEATALLEKITKAGPGDLVTEQAHASLERLARRPAPSP